MCRHAEQVREASAGRERRWRRRADRQEQREQQRRRLFIRGRRATGGQDPVHHHDDGQLVGYGLWWRSGQVFRRDCPAARVHRQRLGRHQRLRQNAHQHLRQKRGPSLFQHSLLSISLSLSFFHSLSLSLLIRPTCPARPKGTFRVFTHHKGKYETHPEFFHNTVLPPNHFIITTSKK